MTTPSVDGETLLARLNALFTEDPAIDEIGLILGVEAEDLTADDAFQLAEHKLGVAFSAGPPVFRAARTQFHTLNAKLHAGEITDRESDVSKELLACTRAVVLISADFYTAWNTRKELVHRGWLLASDEVAFTTLVFSLHPKSIDTWAYRRWLATRLTQELSAPELEVFFNQQVDLCGMLANRFPRNYHAWSFRHWIVSRFSTTSQLEQELAVMETWCATHLKDHSGWNHRQHVLQCLLKKTGSGKATTAFELLVNEYGFLSGILATYPMYEALWCHRRFVMQALLLLVSPPLVDVDDDGFVKASYDILRYVQRSEIMGENHEWLHSQFASAQASLVQPTSVPHCALQDMATAWRCGNRFARRYAAWLVQRFHSMQRSSPTNATAIEQINHAMRASLTSDDALLTHLWRAVA